LPAPEVYDADPCGGAISAGVYLVGLIVMIVLWSRMLSVRDNDGMRAMSKTPLAELSVADRRRLLHALRHGEVVPAEFQDVALRWARHQVLRRGVCWGLVVVGLMLAASVPNDLANYHVDWLSGVAFWEVVAALCFYIPGVAYLWRDQRIAVRLLRGSSRPA
jgi:hypothetical protein